MQTDYFLDITDPKIEGESQQMAHRNQIEMDNWSWSESQTGTAAFGAGSGSGKVTMHDFTFSKRLDQAGPKLQNLCSTGKHIATATFYARRSGEIGGAAVDYLKIVFNDCIISSYQITVGGDDSLREDISFNFAQIQVVYKEIVQGVAQGFVGAGYNVKEARKIAMA